MLTPTDNIVAMLKQSYDEWDADQICHTCGKRGHINTIVLQVLLNRITLMMLVVIGIVNITLSVECTSIASRRHTRWHLWLSQ